VDTLAQLVLDIIKEKKKLTNGELYNEYLHAAPENSDVLIYSIFNVNVRQVLNTSLVVK